MHDDGLIGLSAGAHFFGGLLALSVRLSSPSSRTLARFRTKQLSFAGPVAGFHVLEKNVDVFRFSAGIADDAVRDLGGYFGFLLVVFSFEPRDADDGHIELLLFDGVSLGPKADQWFCERRRIVGTPHTTDFPHGCQMRKRWHSDAACASLRSDGKLTAQVRGKAPGPFAA